MDSSKKKLQVPSIFPRVTVLVLLICCYYINDGAIYFVEARCKDSAGSPRTTVDKSNRHRQRYDIFSFWKSIGHIIPNQLPKLYSRTLFMKNPFSVLLTLPPSVRLAMNQEDALREDCRKASSSTSFSNKNEKLIWLSHINDCNYQFAMSIFEEIQKLHYHQQEQQQEEEEKYKQTTKTTETETTRTIWLPKIEKGEIIKPFVDILNNNSKRLSGLQVTVSSWPKSPATNVQIKFNDNNNVVPAKKASKSSSTATIRQVVASSKEDTERWVEEKLCGLGLCPYTASMQRAAVGLENVGVKEGAIIIRHSNDDDDETKSGRIISSSTSTSTCTNPAISLSVAFWKGVIELSNKSETDVATLLIIGSEISYDDNFIEFASTFDELIEPCVQCTDADKIVGRAVFHPKYNSSQIFNNNNNNNDRGRNDGNSVLPGHALPASMVQSFVTKYSKELATTAATMELDLQTIADANDAVRWTPHATINLLRRSQLSASKKAEGLNPNKKPNFIYAKNIQRIYNSGILDD